MVNGFKNSKEKIIKNIKMLLDVFQCVFYCVFYCLKGIEDFKKVENMIELVVKYYEVKKCFD